MKLEQEKSRREQDEQKRKQDELEKERRLGLRFLVAAIAAAVLAIVSIGLAVMADTARRKSNQDAVRANRSETKSILALKKALEETKRADAAAGLAAARAKIAESRRLAALSESERDKHLDRALLLAVESVQMERTSEARKSLLNALLTRPGISSLLHTGERNVSSVAFSTDGNTLAACDHGDGVVLWDLTVRERMPDTPFVVPNCHVESLAFSRDGSSKMLVAAYSGEGGSGSGALGLCGAAATHRNAPPVQVGSVRSVAFSPDGKIVAAACGNERGGESELVLWKVAQQVGQLDKPIHVVEGHLRSVAFSPDGKTLATGYANSRGGGGVVLWDAAQGQRSAGKQPELIDARVESVAFSSDGNRLAAGYGNDRGAGGVELWDLSHPDRKVEKSLDVPEGVVKSIAFSVDGTTLAAGYHAEAGTGGVVFWTVRDVSVELMGHWPSTKAM